ncbi:MULTISPECIES: Hsp20/alpha crystallin family protein [Mesorhizobium]|uniref:Heat shock protein Hsp20 n=1 Tax=Mesorhizobium opportunistum (strain LMG 24607 / HAMBI 3007 / WSM2075) TaxID=536019 RepID=F7Y880_MESOW|nr:MULTISPECIES: Hsp20/alpha crystallin family protein [Mesorhizobium]AEH87535.1 heat shock protein Hsp20 [Mesorhizobium opportunistum WSM2075]MCA0034526.1 Hsp20/alpha crystallin family protein [Mesorhizobium sp. B263B2A]
MAIRDLMPWSREGSQAPTLFRDRDQDPFMNLHREMSRLVDDMFRGFDSRLPSMGRLSSFGGGWPSVEISETDKEIRVTAEIPGMEEKDIEVLLDDGVLTLRGEKQAETDDKERQFSERFYGRFERRIPLGFEVAEDKVAADFRNGVLSVTLPKTEKAQSRTKRIPIGGGSTKH